MKKTFLVGSLVLGVMLFTGCQDTKQNSDGLPPSESGITSSIACFQTEQQDKAYVAHCYVHSVNGNSDGVSGLKYNVSLVNNLKVDGSSKGTISTTEPISFTDYTKDFIKADVKKTDNLIILATEGKTDVTYLGNWNLSSVDNANQLTLKERSLFMETTEELSYVIGNETRYVNGNSATAHIEIPDETTVSKDEGSDVKITKDKEAFYYFDIVYDPILKGEVVFIGASTADNRVGTSAIMKLELASEEDQTPEDQTPEV